MSNVHLAHILECIQAIESYYADEKDPKLAFYENDKTQQATLHRLQTMGESAKLLPEEMQQAISADIDWRALADFRNVLAHGYLSIDKEIVWHVIEYHLPVLFKSIEVFLEKKNGQ